MKKIIYLILLALTLSACNDAGEKNDITKSTNFSISEGTNRTYNHRALANESTYESVPNGKTVSERAQTISEAVTNMDGIEKAAVIISGNAAIVGITTSDEFTDQQITKFKKDVEEKVKLTDKGVKIVAVTASADLVKRITELSVTNSIGSKEDLDTRKILNQIPSSNDSRSR